MFLEFPLKIAGKGWIRLKKQKHDNTREKRQSIGIGEKSKI